MTDENKDGPEIIVDDDWKSRVEAEKEQLKKEMEETPVDQQELPPASLATIITTFGSQAMAAMGHFPDPATGKPMIHKPLARHLIDSLGVLEEKTKGNLTEDESSMLTNMLHQLRMLFVGTPDQMPESEETQKTESTIELP